jgi:hypothetical protein
VAALAPPATADCPGEGSCLIADLTPGCKDVACCEAVCKKDPVCCNLSWDQGCVDLAVQLCDVCPAPGGCLVFHPNPGCEDAACCDAVCAVMPLCCQTIWDGACAGEAELQCMNLCLGDTNDDGTVDVQDMVQVIIDWGCEDPPGPCLGDVDSDGDVEVNDLVFVILNWGACG